MENQTNTITRRTITELMDAPAMPITNFFCDILGLPPSTVEAEVLRGNTPPRIFKIGRRRYITKEAALDWLDEYSRHNEEPVTTYGKRRTRGAA